MNCDCDSDRKHSGDGFCSIFMCVPWFVCLENRERQLFGRTLIMSSWVCAHVSKADAQCSSQMRILINLLQRLIKWFTGENWLQMQIGMSEGLRANSIGLFAVVFIWKKTRPKSSIQLLKYIAWNNIRNANHHFRCDLFRILQNRLFNFWFD